MNKLLELAELAGISSSYIDKVGEVHYTSDEVRRFFLNAMGFGVDNNEQIEQSLTKIKEVPILPKVMSFFENENISFCVKKNGFFKCKLIDEGLNVVWQNDVKGFDCIHLEKLKFGYYNLVLFDGDEEIKSLIIYAPKNAYSPQFIENNEHLYGVAVMLYALHSQNSMGIGDFSDLAEIVKLTAKHGGDVVGINPLGVMSHFMQSDVSPYRTLSRMFVNYVYLDLRKEVDFIESDEVQNFVNSAEISAEIKSLNLVEKVEYVRVLKLKLQIFEKMFNHFNSCNDYRKSEFEKYCQEKGDELDNLAVFEVLLEENAPESFWRYWKNDYDKINSESVKNFVLHNKERICFYKYCHWLSDLQIKEVQNLAKSLNMKIGLYSDMPIGAASNGAEVWENPDAYVLEAGVGAPADPMRPKGQSWGFTPYHPHELKNQYYAPFIKLVRENMQYSGALRIDHAMGLRRLFWGFFTEDNPVVQGAYVYYEIKDLVAILTLESNRYKCVIIGEDLGTVPEGFREYMAEHNLLSYKVFCRQKEKDGSFIVPDKYMYMSLAQSSTHDQATACGFWSNEDIKVFKQCNLYVNDEQYINNLNGRRLDRLNMISAFEKQKMLLSSDKTDMENSVEKGNIIPQNINMLINEYGAKTNSALFLVRLNDIYKQIVLDNAPGTVVEYPNWRIKMSHGIEDICNSKQFADMMIMIKNNRPK